MPLADFVRSKEETTDTDPLLSGLWNLKFVDCSILCLSVASICTTSGLNKNNIAVLWVTMIIPI